MLCNARTVYGTPTRTTSTATMATSRVFQLRGQGILKSPKPPSSATTLGSAHRFPMTTPELRTHTGVMPVGAMRAGAKATVTVPSVRRATRRRARRSSGRLTRSEQGGAGAPRARGDPKGDPPFARQRHLVVVLVVRHEPRPASVQRHLRAVASAVV